MKKIAPTINTTVDKVTDDDIYGLARIQLLADRRMDFKTGHTTRFKKSIDETSLEKHCDAWADYFNNIVNPPEPDPFAFALKAHQKGLLLGCLFGVSAKNASGHTVPCFEGLFVHPDFWKKKIASTLMAAGLQTVKEAGAKNVQLWAEFNNQHLNDFYTSLGWTRKAQHMKPFNINGRETKAVLFEFKL